MNKKISKLLLLSAGMSVLFCGCGKSNGNNKVAETTTAVIETTAQMETHTEKQTETQTTLSAEDSFRNELKWVIEPQYDYVNVEPLVDIFPTKEGFNNESVVTTNKGQMLVSNATGKVYVDNVDKIGVVNKKVYIQQEHMVINAKGERVSLMPNSGLTSFYNISDNKMYASELGGMSKTDGDYYIFRNIVGNIEEYQYTVLDTYTLYDGRTNKSITDKVYDNARVAADLKMSGDCFVVCNEGLWGFVNTEGENITDFIYEDAYIMNNGIAAVKKDGKAGYIDSTGKELCPFIFDETRSIQNNVAWVKYNGQWGVLNASILTGEEPDLEAIIADIEK